ncbi:MAG: acetylxylan esterase [Eubacteriales bacterium]|jgi:cephalosporin-C deacetylase
MYNESRTEQALKTRLPQTKHADYDAFWDETLALVHKDPLMFTREPYPYPGTFVKVWGITFNGFEGQKVYGWLVVPQTSSGKLPCVVCFHGGHGSRGNPAGYMAYAAAGFAVVTIDPRGQNGVTQDNRAYTSGANGEFILRGILDEREHYLRGLYMDCVRAVEFAAAQPEIDPARIVVEGASQGGACAMAAAAFSNIPALALPNVPSFCCFPRRIENRQACLRFVADYLCSCPENTDRVLATLSYFDVINLADRVRCPVYASVGLMDTDAPADFFIGAYHYIPGEKQIEVYPFNSHGNVSYPHFEKALRYAARSMNISDG